MRRNKSNKPMTVSSEADRLRIAFAVHDARPGGGQDLYALRLVNGLARRHEVTLFACSTSGLDESVRFVPIRTAKRPLLLRARQFAQRAGQLIEDDKWDVVHAVGGALPGAAVVTAQFCHAGWLSRQRSTPDRVSSTVTKMYRRFENRAASRHEEAAVRSPSLRALIGVSQGVMHEWIEAYGVTPPQHAVIPNAVDLERFAPPASGTTHRLRAALAIPSDAFVLLSVGTLVRKGIETGISCLSRLPKTVHLVVVGAGPHQRVHAIAQRAGVAERLHLIHPVSDIERYYHMANALLFPTRYEPFGMVIAEAWAAGLPVICSSVAGALEWSRHDETAIHVGDPTDDQGFTDAVRRLSEDTALAQRLAEGGHDLARQFSWERVVTETENLYRRML